RIATPDGKRRYVRLLFATIADRYDFITRALSYGQDQRWKRRLVDLAAPRPGARALDLATGTGDIAFALAARGARVAGLDIAIRTRTGTSRRRFVCIRAPTPSRACSRRGGSAACEVIRSLAG